MRPAPGAAEDGPAAPPPTTAAPAPVHQRHFLAALARTAPSVSLADERRYNALRGRMEQARFSLAADAPAAAAAGVEGGPSPGEADAAGPGGAVAGPGVA